MTTIDNTQDTIDSRDVIERIEQLEAEQAELVEKLDSGEITESDMLAFDNEQGKELDSLRELAEQAESSPDWTYGETLIRRSYFEQYIADLIDECYDLPKQLGSGEWPWRHVQIDIESAAEEAEQDYIEVNFGGVEYLIRA